MNRPTLRKPPAPARSVSPRAPDGRDRQVGEQIRRYRLLRRLTQARVAAQAGISHQQLHKYEDGSSRISMGRLYSLAEALNVPVTWFLTEDIQSAHQPLPASRPLAQEEELLCQIAAMALPAPEPLAASRQGPPVRAAGSAGAAAALPRGRQRL